MYCAFKVLANVQKQVGGKIIFLECEDKTKLKSFYQNEFNNFKIYGKRISAKENQTYLQMLRFLQSDKIINYDIKYRMGSDLSDDEV